MSVNEHKRLKKMNDEILARKADNLTDGIISILRKNGIMVVDTPEIWQAVNNFLKYKKVNY